MKIAIEPYQRQVTPNGVGVTPRAEAVPVSPIAGQALERLGVAAEDYLAQMRHQNNVAATDDAYANKFGPQFRDLYQQYYSLQGKDALDQRPDFEKRIGDLRTEVRTSLENDQQRRYFDGLTLRRTEDEFAAMARHAAQQRRAWIDTTHAGAQSNYLTDIADKSNDDQAFDLAIRGGLAEIDQYGTTTGRPAEATRAESMAFASKAWSTRIETELGRDPLNAQRLYEANAKVIAPTVRPVLEHKLKVAAYPVQAKTIATDLLTDLDNGTSRDVRANEGQLLEEAQRRADELHPNDPVFADVVAKEVKGHLATRAAAVAATEQQAWQTALGAAIGTIDPMTGRYARAPVTTPAQLMRDPAVASAWTTLTPDRQKAVLAVIDDNARKVAGDGETMRTDPHIFQDVWDRMRLPEDDPRKIRTFADVDPYLGRGLSQASYKFLRDQFDQRRTEDGQRLDKTRQQFFSAMKPTLDKSTLTNMDGEGAARFYNFQQYVLGRERALVKKGLDAYGIYDPNSPDFAGKSITMFQASLAEQAANVGRIVGGATVTPLPADKQRRPGESIDAYRKRVGLQ
jgi:hypothetical protein